MKKIPFIIGTIILLTIIAGCKNLTLGDLSDEDLERISEKAVVCDKPYIRVGIDCCLDKNDNSICDVDEVEIVEEKPELEEITCNEGYILS